MVLDTRKAMLTTRKDEAASAELQHGRNPLNIRDCNYSARRECWLTIPMLHKGKHVAEACDHITVTP